MTDKEQIKKVFEDFEEGGLVTKNIQKVLDCLSDRIIGIGVGEQGYVRSKEEIRHIFEGGIREDDKATYSLAYNEMEILIHDGKFANAFGDITIVKMEDGVLSKSRLQQTLVFLKEEGAWRICGLHASAPMVTEESIEAYPLKVAEKLLSSLREGIGEKAFLAEEQFQQAILADTIAFYIINFTKNIVEKCQVNRELCVYAEAGTPYEDYMRSQVPNYVVDEDQDTFINAFSLKSIQEAFARNENEVSCEYQMKHADGGSLWAVTVIRLITDCVTGDQKGIMYVKDIDRQKCREIEMRRSAECDDMTELYNRTAFSGKIDLALSVPDGTGGVFFMLDVDNFKAINDTYGHPFGDRVLKSVTETLRELFRDTGILGRLGGDEFGVFVSEETVSGLTEGRLREFMHRLEKIHFSDDITLRLTCSIGLTETKDTRSFEQLYLQADKALYHSKQNGKDQWTVY